MLMENSTFVDFSPIPNRTGCSTIAPREQKESVAWHRFDNVAILGKPESDATVDLRSRAGFFIAASPVVAGMRTQFETMQDNLAGRNLTGYT
jgi:hypothetical protein